MRGIAVRHASASFPAVPALDLSGADAVPPLSVGNERRTLRGLSQLCREQLRHYPCHSRCSRSGDAVHHTGAPPLPSAAFRDDGVLWFLEQEAAGDRDLELAAVEEVFEERVLRRCGQGGCPRRSNQWNAIELLRGEKEICRTWAGAQLLAEPVLAAAAALDCTRHPVVDPLRLRVAAPAPAAATVGFVRCGAPLETKDDARSEGARGGEGKSFFGARERLRALVRCHCVIKRGARKTDSVPRLPRCAHAGPKESFDANDNASQACKCSQVWLRGATCMTHTRSPRWRATA